MRIVPATRHNPALSRVIGTLDFRGSGTNHPLHDVNPFMLFDEGSLMTKAGIPPFGLHPHSGAFIVTICLSGNVEYITIKNGKKDVKVLGPGPFLAAVDTGFGLVHDEHTHTADPCKLFQLIWMTADNKSDAAMMHVEKPLFIHEENGTNIMLCAGSFRGKDSGITCRQVPSVTVLYITIPPGSTFETDEFCEGNTFIYNTVENDEKASLYVNEEKVPVANIAVISMEENANQLKLTNKGDSEIGALVGYGKPINPIWTKLLMGNGFIFAKSEEEALKKEEYFKKVGIYKFGQKDSCVIS